MVVASLMAAAADRSGHVAGDAARRAVRFAAMTLLGRGRGLADAKPAIPQPVSFLDAQAVGFPPVTVAYERSGAGEPVVLLHGLGLNHRTWDAVLPYLTGDREVIAIDLPGFGQSPDWPAGLRRDLPNTVMVLEALFTALGVERPHVVGHSLGGLIALRLGQAGLARTVTALAPAGFWNEAERRYAFAVLAAVRRIARTVPDTAAERLSATAAGRAILAGMLYGDPAQCPPGAVTDCLHTLRDAAGFEATLRAGRPLGLFAGPVTGVPVTIAWGTEDRILLPRQARRAARLLPQARLVWLSGCGHVPMNDAPERVAEVIVEATSPDLAARGPAARAFPTS
jgi:pimeloyl-ACP methyl ester carboxylesterase